MGKKIFFNDSAGKKLCGKISNPSKEKTNPVTILCHGFTSSKDSSTNIALEKKLNKKGFSTFRFDLFGHGESEGKIENNTITIAEKNVLGAIKYLKSDGYTNLSLIGSSFGGMACVLAASKTPELLSLALKSPVSKNLGKLVAKQCNQKIEEWREKGHIYFTGGYKEKTKINYSLYQDAEKIDAHKAAKNIKAPTLIVHGEKDKVVPVHHSKELAGLIPNCKLKIIKGANHSYEDEEKFKKMIKIITHFLIKETNNRLKDLSN